VSIRIFAFMTWTVVRYALRDRMSAAVIFLLPFAIISLVGTILAPTANRPLGLVVSDHGAWAKRLAVRLSHDHDIELHRYATLTQLKTAVREERVAAGLEIPANFDAALAGRGITEARFIVEREELVPAALRLAVDRNLTVVAAAGTAARYAAQLGHVPARVAARRALSAASDGMAGLHVEQVVPAAPLAYTGVSFSAPGTLVLFIFLSIMATGSGLVTARQLGVPRRMLSTATGPWTIALSEAAGRVALGLLQALVIIVVGALAFHVRWGSIGLVLTVALLAATISAALAVIASSISATPQQAFVLAPAVMITAAMLGGCLWPEVVMGPALRITGRLFPPAWAMDALLRLGAGGGSSPGILLDIGVLLAFAVVLTPIAVTGYRRKISVSS
jgi:ABC-2 type transport system permease protein